MNIASNILKILLFIFAIGVMFIGVYVLPTMAGEMVVLYPELEYAKLPVLITSEILLVLLLIGIGMIMYLLVVFDRGLTFSSKFIRGVEVLVAMCIVASIGVMGIFQYMTTFGGPGPLLSLVIVGVTFIIWIVAAVIMLIRAIVKKAIVFKNDYDLTV